MNRSAGAVIEQANQYASLFDRVSVGGRFDEASSDGAIRLTTDQELLEATHSVTRLIRLAEAERTKLAGEIARRSEPRDETSLARRMGASSASHLVAEVTGVPRSQAGTLVASGIAFRAQENAFTGEPLEAKYPKLAAAFEAGLLDPEVAAALRRAVGKASPGLTPGEVGRLEETVVTVATEGWDAEFLFAYAKRVPEMAHPGFGAPTPAGPTPLPTVTRRVLENGLIRWVADLDPLTDGFLTTAIDANTTMKRSLLNTGDESEPDPATDDRRPLAQRRVDGLRLVAKKAVKMDDGQVGGTAVTMHVTIPLTALLTGLGTAELPDCGTEITASVARMLAADAEIIPVVLGGKSQPMDLGLGRRFFTEAQRRAMAVRDGGCVGPGCGAPPSWCDGAHIRPAGYGRTSLDNGVLLCWRCHLLLDQQGWQLNRIDERWWWTPPPWVDPTGRKRPGGRIPTPDLSI